jgi:hypothetical protein
LEPDDFEELAFVVFAALVVGEADAPEAAQRYREPSLVQVKLPSFVPTFALEHSWPAVAADADGTVRVTLAARARPAARAMERRRLMISFR